MTRIERMELDAMRAFLIKRYQISGYALFVLEKTDPDLYREIMEDMIRAKEFERDELAEIELLDEHGLMRLCG